MRPIRVGSRGSDLALTQTRGVIAQLTKLFPDLSIEIDIIRTVGDKITDVPLSRVGDRGLFIKDIEVALLEGRVDFAVHSAKDVPSRIPEDLVLAATTRRLDPSDALVARGASSLSEMPPGASVATGSLRRRAQLLAHRPDLSVPDLRGNVPTRIQKFDASPWDGILLARAGLERLGLAGRVSEVLSPKVMLPAVGQGALLLEARADDRDLLERLARLDHGASSMAVRAERAFLRRLEGGCQVPIGALGTLDGERLRLRGFVGTPDGRRHRRDRIEGSWRDGEALGEALAESLLSAGGDEILAEVRALAEGAPPETGEP